MEAAAKYSLTQKTLGPKEVHCLSAEASARLSGFSTPGNPSIRCTKLAPLCTHCPHQFPSCALWEKMEDGRRGMCLGGLVQPAGPPYLYPYQWPLHACFQLGGDGTDLIPPRRQQDDSLPRLSQGQPFSCKTHVEQRSSSSHLGEANCKPEHNTSFNNMEVY